MQIQKKDKSNKLSHKHSLIISKLKKSILKINFEPIIIELPPKSVLVGGYLRDLILDKLSPFPDIDIIIPNNALSVAKSLAEKFSGRFLVLDNDRNIARIIFKEFIIDIANRTHDLLADDLKARDFTINSISYSFDSNKIIDPVNGIYDLENSLLRCFNYKNLLDDPLRMLRCFRFVSELNFHIEPNLFQFIKENKSKLSLVSVERIQTELKKIVSGKQACEVTISLNEIKFFDWIQTYQKNSLEFLLSVNYENYSSEEVEKYMPIFYLRELLKKSVVKEFKFSKIDELNINNLRTWSNLLKRKSIEHFNEIERFNLHKELEIILPAFIVYLPHDCHNYWLNRWRDKNDRLFHPQNFINGYTLKTLVGIDDGPLLGKLLSYLSREYAYERLNNFDEAIYEAKRWFQQNAPKCD